MSSFKGILTDTRLLLYISSSKGIDEVVISDDAIDTDKFTEDNGKPLIESYGIIHCDI